MSLNWDTTKCERIPRDENGNITEEFFPTLESAIWGMLTTGVGWELTDKNAGKYYSRYRIAALTGGYNPLSMEDVHKLVGLKTNVSPEYDDAWLIRIIERDLKD